MIVEAVGTAAGRGGLTEALHARISAAQAEAVRQAQEEGVTDPDEIRRRILAARDEARAG